MIIVYNTNFNREITEFMALPEKKLQISKKQSYQEETGGERKAADTSGGVGKRRKKKEKQSTGARATTQ